MCKINSRIWNKFRETCCHICNVIHPVVYIINLSVSSKFSVDRLPDNFFIIFHNVGLNWDTIHRRLFQNTHIADSDHAHMKSSWDRSCRQCQYINIFLELFDFFFMGNTKSLFFIDDQKAQVFECDIF